MRHVQYRNSQRFQWPDGSRAPAHSRDTARIETDHRGDEVMAPAAFRVWRGDRQGGAFRDYPTEVSEGMVVLDAMHKIQADQANDLSLRWNCKAGKCGSCSAEINGLPKLMCMTRLNTLRLDQPVTVEPMRAFPPIKDLVTDVSWNFRDQVLDWREPARSEEHTPVLHSHLKTLSRPPP